jgi:F-type H+-transporting ATPase subunit gamma
MAGGQERALRSRIRSIQATKKITRAMELIAASRIVKAQQRVHAAVPYSEQITQVVKDLAAAGGSESSSPLLVGRPDVKKVCYVAVVADRGLCGGYNSGVLRSVEGEIKADIKAGRDYTIVTVGKKGEAYFRFRGYKMAHSVGGFSENPTYDQAKALGQKVVELFDSGEVDSVQLVYTRFVSAGFQEVVLRPLVPLDRELTVGGTGDNPRHPRAPLHRSARLRRVAERRRVRARGSPAGHEGRYRQR